MTTKLPQVIIFLLVLINMAIIPVSADQTIAFNDPTKQLTDLNFAAYKMQGTDTAPVFIGYVNTTNSVISVESNASVVFMYQPYRSDYLNHPEMILPALQAWFENYFTTVIGIAIILGILILAIYRGKS